MNFLGWRYFRLSLYSTVTNLLCTGTAVALAAGGSVRTGGLCALSPVLVSAMLGLIGTKAAFSVVGSSSGGGMSLPSDKSAAMAVLVSSLLAFTVRVPISGGSAFAVVEVEVEALASVPGTCIDCSLVVTAVFPADRGDINLCFL